MSATGAPSARSTGAVWTGTEMIVWGGGDGRAVHADGARYDPAQDVWHPIASAGTPSARALHTVIWTGSEVVVWGGVSFGLSSVFGDGAAYRPSTDSWRPLASLGAPEQRALHTAVWTGSEMIVWGGAAAALHGDGGRYSPERDAWVVVPRSELLTARMLHSAVWTGSEMIVWGGGSLIEMPPFGDGGVHDVAAGAWSPLEIGGEPSARRLHSAVWTGSEMIIWGGADRSGYQEAGARYRP